MRQSIYDLPVGAVGRFAETWYGLHPYNGVEVRVKSNHNGAVTLEDTFDGTREWVYTSAPCFLEVA